MRLTMALTLAGNAAFSGHHGAGCAVPACSDPNRDYQPMRISFGLMDTLPELCATRSSAICNYRSALEHIDAIIDNLPHNPHEVNVCS